MSERPPPVNPEAVLPDDFSFDLPPFSMALDVEAPSQLYAAAVAAANAATDTADIATLPTLLRPPSQSKLGRQRPGRPSKKHKYQNQNNNQHDHNQNNNQHYEADTDMGGEPEYHIPPMTNNNNPMSASFVTTNSTSTVPTRPNAPHTDAPNSPSSFMTPPPPPYHHAHATTVSGIQSPTTTVFMTPPHTPLAQGYHAQGYHPQHQQLYFAHPYGYMTLESNSTTHESDNSAHHHHHHHHQNNNNNNNDNTDGDDHTEWREVTKVIIQCTLMCCVVILVLLGVTVLLVARMGDKDRSEPGDSGGGSSSPPTMPKDMDGNSPIPVTMGSASCLRAPVVEFPPHQGGIFLGGDTMTNGVLVSTTPGCGINTASPSLFFRLAGDDQRYNLTLCTNSGFTNRAFQPPAPQTWQQIRVSIFRDDGTACSSIQEHDSGSNGGVLGASLYEECAASQAFFAADTCQPPLSSVEFFAERGQSYVILVQGVTALDQGQFEINLQRSLVLLQDEDDASSDPYPEALQGSVADATLGVSVALSGNGQLLVACQALTSNDVVNLSRMSGQVRFYQLQAPQSPSQSYGYQEIVMTQPNEIIYGYNVALSHDGKTLAVVTGNTLTVYDYYHPSANTNNTDSGRPVAPRQKDIASWVVVFLQKADNAQQVAGSVTLSGDGNTVAWNVVVTEERRGYVQVFRRRRGIVGGNSAMSSPAVSSSFNTPISWDQLGDRLHEATSTSENVYDKAVALSDDGTLLALAGPHDTARVFTWNGRSWSVRGNQVFDQTTSVAITGNGNCVATGYAGRRSNSKVEVHCFTGSNMARRIGQVLQGGASNFGHSMSFSQGGNLLAVGAPWYTPTTTTPLNSHPPVPIAPSGPQAHVPPPPPPPTATGRAVVYEFDFDTVQWKRKANMGSGVAEDLYGWSVAVAPDQSTVAVGAPWHTVGSGRRQRVNAGALQAARFVL